MRGLPHLLARAYGQPWAILEEYGMAIDRVLMRRAAGEILSEEEIAAAVGASKQAREERAAELGKMNAMAGKVRVLPLWGTVLHRTYELSDVSGEGLMSLEWLDGKIQEAIADPSVAAIVLDVDSPGGTIGGVPELGARILASEKPIVAVANSVAASAAYWLASQAHELYVTPSGMVGSIGVWLLHQDWSKAYEMKGVTNTVIRAPAFKAETLPYGPLTEEARAYLEERIGSSLKDFQKAVAKGRGVTPSVVRDTFGQGRALDAKPALEAGMVDGIATLQEVVDRLAAGGRVKKRGTSAEDPPSAPPPAPAALPEQVEQEAEDLGLLESEFNFRFRPAAKQGRILPGRQS